MKKLLPIASCLIACFVLIGFQQSSQPNGAQPKSVKSSKQKNPSSPSPVRGETADKKDSGERQAESDDQKQNIAFVSQPRTNESNERWMLFFTAVLAAAGVAGTVVAIYAALVAVKTLKQIKIEAGAAVAALEHSGALAEAARTSAETAKVIAEAANKNAQATMDSAKVLMTSERAWILIEEITIIGLDTPGQGGVAVVSFGCHAKNYGKSPAIITFIGLKLEPRAKRDASDKQLDDSIYSPSGPKSDPRIIPPGKDVWVQPLTPLITTPAQIRAINCDGPEREFLFAHGIICYSDALGGEWLTRFNYRYDIAYFAPGGNAGFYFSEGPTGWNTWK